ncbi:unnamed protein product, partial [Discosporangium mesarthrocarpum]
GKEVVVAVAPGQGVGGGAWVVRETSCSSRTAPKVPAQYLPVLGSNGAKETAMDEPTSPTGGPPLAPPRLTTHDSRCSISGRDSCIVVDRDSRGGGDFDLDAELDEGLNCLGRGVLGVSKNFPVPEPEPVSSRAPAHDMSISSTVTLLESAAQHRPGLRKMRLELTPGPGGYLGVSFENERGTVSSSSRTPLR